MSLLNNLRDNQYSELSEQDLPSPSELRLVVGALLKHLEGSFDKSDVRNTEDEPPSGTVTVQENPPTGDVVNVRQSQGDQPA